MRHEYYRGHCNADFLARELTELSKQGWELVALIGEPRMVQLSDRSAAPDQQWFLCRRWVVEDALAPGEVPPYVSGLDREDYE